MNGDGGGHDALAVAGDPVAASSGELGYQAVAAELDDQSGDPLASPVGLVAVGGWPPVEAVGDVDVAEALDGVFAGHRGSEQGQVGGVGRVEAGVSAPVVGSGPAQGVEGGDAFAFQGGSGEGVQVAVIGRDASLVVAPQVADPFSHRAPPPLAPALVVGDEPQDLELNRNPHTFVSADSCCEQGFSGFVEGPRSSR